MALDRRNVEAGKMENLQDRRIAHQRPQIGCAIGAAIELDDMGVAVTRRQLHDAERVARGIEAHRLGVDGDAAAEGQAVRQIALVQRDRHVLAPLGPEGRAAGDPVRKPVAAA